jgi:hypothetical protein
MLLVRANNTQNATWNNRTDEGCLFQKRAPDKIEATRINHTGGSRRSELCSMSDF